MVDPKISKEQALYMVPAELWDIVRSSLSYFSSHALRNVLGYEPSAEDNHSRIWNYFFKSDDWLNAAYNEGVNPCLIGYDLYPLLYDKHSTFNVTTKKDSSKRLKCLSLALVFGRDQDSRANPALKREEMRDLFNKSLQPFESRTRHEIVFANGARLNISDIVQEEFYTNVPHPRQLVSRKLDGLHSACLYWKDELKVCDIKPKDVFGIGKGLTKKNVSRIVGLNWKNLPSGKVHQHVFNIPGMILQTEAIKKDNKITRFKWLLEWEINTEGGLKSNVLASNKKRHEERLRQATEREAARDAEIADVERCCREEMKKN
ncbi:hypothetical protein V493_00260 [Pseudogymnoascus sp. VKM F-4281 (FW-2241)]|nr:hypothetical protein V493_00260 [Pseudogymnoascus sp. VKM F-4281 (FW-2241)]